MILIKKFPAPSDLETLKKEAEEQGLSDKDGYATVSYTHLDVYKRQATWRRGFLSGCQNAAGRRTAMDGAGRAELRNHSAANAEKNK